MLPANQKYQIHIEGTVQGVGFRPFVYQIAQSLSVMGWVRNTYFGAEILCQCPAETFEEFRLKLQTNAPSAAHISALKWTPLISDTSFNDFSIIESITSQSTLGQITPEHAICDTCSQEVSDAKNRRYQYPFTTCSTCGPRYGILRKLPFDRANTSMSDFELCHECLLEYQSASNRRFHAQTISCETCGPKLSAYIPSNGTWIQGNLSCIEHIVSQLEKGNIITIKGLGGFLLLCDASKKESIVNLRTRKNRPSKPLALLFPKNFKLDTYFELRQEEEKILQSKIAPIVLLRAKMNALSTLISTHEIAPNLNTFGIMLPSTALLHIIGLKFGKPLVATSANVSGSPIIFDNKMALSELETIADSIVIDNRILQLGQDDSVIQYADHQKIILRRARGLAPNFGPIHTTPETCNAIALGAGLKHTFGIFKKPYLYVSQYFGDTETLNSQENIKANFAHLQSMLDIKGGQYLSDGHPSYFSTKWGETLNAIQIPHHHAHFTAVLAENCLFDESVMGVIFDGSGWHPDGHIRGGEFLAYHPKQIKSVCSFEPFQHILGNKMASEPRISALSLSYSHLFSELETQFTNAEWSYYHKLLENQKGLSTHSVGRIFDAVSSLLGLCSKQEYEGKAALLLENCANTFENHHLDLNNHYLSQVHFEEYVPTKTLIYNILQDIKLGVKHNQIAFKFHLTLVAVIQQIAEKHHFKSIAFSGGVFQNALLVRLLQQHLSPVFNLYFHKNLSPNDENISFGQLNYYFQLLN